MILIYTNEDKDRIAEVLDANRFDYAFVGDEQKGITMRELLEHPQDSKASGPLFVYISGLDEKQQSWLSAAFKENGIYTGRVAIQTVHNIDWTLADLMEEVENEYQYFSLRDTLYDLITHPDKERLASDKEYLSLMAYGLSLIESEQSSAEQLRDCVEKIQNVQTVALSQRLKRR